MPSLLAKFSLLCALSIPVLAHACEGSRPLAPGLQQDIEGLAARAHPAVFGVAVLDLCDGRRWGVQRERRFGMMSDFKAPVAAAVLARVDKGSLSLHQEVKIARADVVRGAAVRSVGDKVLEGRDSFTIAELLHASVTQSDNTAVDALLRVLGGARAVGAWLKEAGVSGMQVEASERALAQLFFNHGGSLAPPPGETPEQKDSREEGGYRRFLAAPPNHTTPDGAVSFLERLWSGKLLSPPSTRHLLDLMAAQAVPPRLRLGLPPGSWIANKTGTAGAAGKTAAYNDIAVLRLPGGRVLAVAAYLADSPAMRAERDQLFADLARALGRAAAAPAR